MLFAFWMLAILLLLVTAHGYWMYQEIPLTFAYVDDLKARGLAWSAVNIAAGSLLADGADTDLGVVVTEVGMFGRNRADVRINEEDCDDEPEFVELYNNSDFEQNLDGWQILSSAYSPDVTFTSGDVILAHSVLRTEVTSITNGTHSVYLFDNSRGIVEDSVLIDTLTIGSVPGGGLSWQVLPDGSNGEYWAGQRAPFDVSAAAPYPPGWVTRAPTDSQPNGEGEWILPGSAIYNAATGESYVFFGSKTKTETIAYWVPADTYFIVAAGSSGGNGFGPTLAEFNTFYRLPAVAGKDPIMAPVTYYDAGVQKAVRAYFDAFQSFADVDASAADSFLFPRGCTGPLSAGVGPNANPDTLDLYFFRPADMRWRFHTPTTPILYPTVNIDNLTAVAANRVGKEYQTLGGYLYGRITSAMTPYWRSFVHIGGDSLSIRDVPSRATWPRNPDMTRQYRPDTHWNWRVPGESSSIVLTDSVSANSINDSWSAALSPFDNHDPTADDWGSAGANLLPSGCSGTWGDWDTYGSMSVGLGITEVFNAPPAVTTNSWCTHIVIAKVGQYNSTSGEYVLLFNPTNAAINLNGGGMSFSIRTSTTGTGKGEAWFPGGATIDAYDYYLIGDGLLDDGSPVQCDFVDSITVGTDGYVVLIDTMAGASGDTHDAVGWGTPAVFEGTAVGSLVNTANQEIRRNPPGDTGLDQGNNSADFPSGLQANAPVNSTTPASPAPASNLQDKYDFIEFYNTAYDSSVGEPVSHPWTGNLYGGGLAARDYPYEYVELHNTSTTSVDMANVEFIVSDTTGSWKPRATRYLRPWITGGPTSIPAAGCALILPAGADTRTIGYESHPALVLLGLGASGGAATDTQLGCTAPFRNEGDAFKIGNGSGTNWFLNFSNKGFTRGGAVVKGNPYQSDPTAFSATPLGSSWSAPGGGSPGICPSDVDHLLEEWATLTREATGLNGTPNQIDATDPSIGYYQIWVYDESGKLAFNQPAHKDLLLDCPAPGTAYGGGMPDDGPDAATNDVTDTYVTPMDLFYLVDAGGGNSITASKVRNVTVYANEVLNVNTVDQYAQDSDANGTPDADDLAVLRTVIEHTRLTHGNPVGAASVTDRAQRIVAYRQGADLLDGTADDNPCDTEDLQTWISDAFGPTIGTRAAEASAMVTSGHFSKESQGYFTVVGEGLLAGGAAGDTLGRQVFWTVWERGWSGKNHGSLRYWRDNWRKEVMISREGSLAPE